uniref:Ribosomal protein L23 n=6 Tax=Pinus subgen. Strobus TaxID=139272 RepID=C3W1I9_PINLA|nr:ribosomal protein L23 [Pinus strobus]ACP51739.1 ribosomal protein L23 [Pinus ayacahuite]ACP52101.1 ribosomal protein L23 [Pinus flexilis]ACP52165.1 ribosomal protein L23 [Pinus lambertiana]AET44554.1 ribosomal protein L23 [Pinus chiapensis]AET45625.1 ribosomal protein L23 [Pinus strobiformis]
MDEVKYPVLTEKSIRLLERNQYTFNVDLQSNKTNIKNWIENFFDVKVIAMNSYRLPEKGGKRGSMIVHPIRCKRMIITLRTGDSIPLFSEQ